MQSINVVKISAKNTSNSIKKSVKTVSNNMCRKVSDLSADIKTKNQYLKDKINSLEDSINNGMDNAYKDAVEFIKNEIIGTDYILRSATSNNISTKTMLHSGGDIIVFEWEGNKNVGVSINSPIKLPNSEITYTPSISFSKDGFEAKFIETDKLGASAGYGFSISTKGLNCFTYNSLEEKDGITTEMKFEKNLDKFKDVVATSVGILGCAATICYLFGNDTTGAGVADDAAIPLVYGKMTDLCENLMGLFETASFAVS